MNYRIRKILYFFKRLPYFLFRGISNLIYWFPTIWKDDQYDYVFLDKIMLKKLIKMRDFFLSNKPQILDAAKCGNEIAEICEYLDKLINQDYEEKFLEKYYAVYPKHDMIFETAYDEDSGCYKLRDNMTREQGDFLMDCLKEARMQMEIDRNKMYDMLNMSTTWWD